MMFFSNKIIGVKEQIMRVFGESLYKNPVGRTMMISLGGQEKEAGAE